MTIDVTEKLDAQRLVDAGVVARVEYYETLPSTHDRAHEVARVEDCGPLPLLVVAEQQTAGRGRGANRWWTGRGSLAFSLLFDPADWVVSRQPLPERSLAIGVAIVDTVAPLLAGHASACTGPTTFTSAQRKLAGILIDVLPARSARGGHRAEREQLARRRARRCAQAGDQPSRSDRLRGRSHRAARHAAWQSGNRRARIGAGPAGIRPAVSASCACKSAAS